MFFDTMEGKVIKVVWICNVMNDIVRAHLCSDLSVGRKLQIVGYRMISGFLSAESRKRLEDYLYYRPQSDYGLWNTNAIQEFQAIKEVELHVIVPSNMTSCPLAEFEEKGIYYHIIKSHDSFLYKALGSKVKLPSYKSDRRRITKIIDKITPDIVHIIGAENPQYSQVAFDIYKKYPVIVQLQTLLSDPETRKTSQSFSQVAEMERKILSLPVYLGTPMPQFKSVILSQINPEARILDIGLAVNEPVARREYEKVYDFVYFSANINKAADLAVSAFILAHQKHPGITLDIIGTYSSEFRSQLESQLLSKDALQSVTFEGSLPTHEDVINKIRQARFALLPLKIDMISGTIREACANGLPIVSTITGGTPFLNKERETALLSEIGDDSAMSENMIRLLEDPELASMLKENGYRYAESLSNNRDMMHKWVDCYRVVIANDRL